MGSSTILFSTVHIKAFTGKDLAGFTGIGTCLKFILMPIFGRPTIAAGLNFSVFSA